MTAPNATGGLAFEMLRDIDVCVSVELGSTEMPLRDVLALGTESVVPLDRLTDELLDLMVNGRRIARGEVVAQDGRFGLRIVELCGAGPGPGSGSAPAEPAAAPVDAETAAAVAAAVAASEGAGS